MIEMKDLIGPYGAYAMILVGFTVLAKKFFETNDKLADANQGLVEAFKQELDACNNRYNKLLERVMRLEVDENRLR